MTEGFNKPPPLKLKGNAGTEWPKWKSCFEIYMSAAGLDGATDKRMINILLNLIGEDAIEVKQTLEYEKKEGETNFDVILVQQHNGLGKIESGYHIEVDTNVTPIVDACRKVPFTSRSKLKEVLNELENIGVVSPHFFNISSCIVRPFPTIVLQES
ncbi:uncharacterized protein [Leptinotarsa decemlineata]|uniref:uncharacterized protein n=1 Tax=Leptinotarsa decemlineata TaxID=7539 RepID=UPI003D306FDA